MGDWDEAEIRRFQKRVTTMVEAGIDEKTAEATAQQLLYRDQPGSADDRRVCFECSRLRGLRCGRLGFEVVRSVLQRCDWFSAKQVRRPAPTADGAHACPK